MLKEDLINYIMIATIISLLCMYFVAPWIITKIKEFSENKSFNDKLLNSFQNKDYMWLYKNDSEEWKNIPCSKEMLKQVSDSVESEKLLEPVCPITMDYLTTFLLDRKTSSYKGKFLEAKRIKCFFYAVQYKNEKPLVKALFETHYGDPVWSNNNMHYDYPINREFKVLELNDLKSFVIEIKEKYYTKDSDLLDISYRF